MGRLQSLVKGVYGPIQVLKYYSGLFNCSKVKIQILIITLKYRLIFLLIFSVFLYHYIGYMIKYNDIVAQF